MKKINEKTILQLALIAGIIILATNNQEGWGWLVFILFFIR